ncbi:MAG: glycosyltransferase family 2 protein [Lachnospiraceae bacterium]|nr:glycosyltransferase family 2 protein [Lachnospiraceae bacterium]
MNLEMLISAVDADPENLIKTMNVNCPAVLVNQCGRVSNVVQNHPFGDVRVFNSDERGVGKSRNKALYEAVGDIVLFCDEDIVYCDGYEKKILKEFEKHPDADGIFFNVKVCAERRTYWNSDFARVRIYNSGRYPAYSLAVKRQSVEGVGIRFSELFGGGSKYSCGEDSLFIRDCLKKKLDLYRTTTVIGEEIPRPSTWFKGYDDKYFFDRGVLYHFLYGILAFPMGVRYVLAKRKIMCREVPWPRALKLIREGIREGKTVKA